MIHPHAHPVRRAFTLIEMMIVITIIAALSAMSYAAYQRVLVSGKNSGTKQLLDGIAATIATYPRDSITVQVSGSGLVKTGGQEQIRRLWDIDLDQVLDAMPNAPGAPTTLNNAPDGYPGFLRMTGMAVPKWAVEAMSLQVRDAWGNPIHIRFGAGRTQSGVGSWNLWSVGPDGIDGVTDPTAITTDDICSWKSID